jgi:hypothetical protein
MYQKQALGCQDSMTAQERCVAAANRLAATSDIVMIRLQYLEPQNILRIFVGARFLISMKCHCRVLS